MMPRSWLLLAICAGFFTLAAAPHPAAADDVVQMEFEGFGPAGLHVLTSHTVIEEASNWYQIEGDVATAGLGAVLVNMANRSVTRGREVASTPKPELFDSETDRGGVAQHLRVDYRS